MSNKTIRTYGAIIDTLVQYTNLGMPLLTSEQAFLTRSVKTLSSSTSPKAQHYLRLAEKLLAI